MPVGNLPGDTQSPGGWKQVYFENFSTDVAETSFTDSAYVDAHNNDPSGSRSRFQATYPNIDPYPTTWHNSIGDGSQWTSYYSGGKTCSVTGSVLRQRLHTEGTFVENGTTYQRHRTETLVPAWTGSKTQTYGRYVIRWRADLLPGYKIAWLLWPISENWPTDGEIDFPEADLAAGNDIAAFMHRQDGANGGDQDAYGSTVDAVGGWNTTEIIWAPGFCRFILDGVVLGTSTSRVPNTPMEWRIQTEGNLDGTRLSTGIDPTTTGYVDIDWIVAYTRTAESFMTSPLPVNIDSSYADSGSDPSIALHQKHHDIIHAYVNIDSAQSRLGLGMVKAISHFPPSHGWSANGFDAATNVADTSVTFSGRQGVSLVTAGNGGYHTFQKTGLTAINLNGGKHVRVTLRIANLANLQEVLLRAAGVGGIDGGTFHQVTIYDANSVQSGMSPLLEGEITTVSLSFADAYVQNSAAGTAVTEWQFVIRDKSGALKSTVQLGGVDVANDVKPSKWSDTGLVIISMDDTYASQINLALPACQERAIRGTFFPILELLDTNGYATTAQMLSAQERDGWEVGVHCSTVAFHNNFASATPIQVAADLQACQFTLAAKGFTGRTSYAYPLGQFDSGRDTAVRPNVKGARTIAGSRLETWPPGNTMRLRSKSGIGGLGGTSGASLTQAGGVLDQVAAHKGLFIATFHNFTSGTSGDINTSTLSDFTTFLDGIVSRGISTATMGEYLAGIA